MPDIRFSFLCGLFLLANQFAVQLLVKEQSSQYYANQVSRKLGGDDTVQTSNICHHNQYKDEDNSLTADREQERTGHSAGRLEIDGEQLNQRGHQSGSNLPPQHDRTD